MSTFWRDFAGTMVGGGDYWAHRAFGDNSNMAMRHTLMGPYGYAEQFNTYPYNNRCWGYTPRYDLARQAMREMPYGKWREFDHEDTVRFYALRLREAGMIKSSPQKIIAEGTDWRFLRELRK